MSALTAWPYLAAIDASVSGAVPLLVSDTDCGTLPKSAVDLQAGWVTFPRPKTAIERRCPLWVETVEAIREAIVHEIACALDEAAFEGSGAFLLGTVLEQFFARYATLNSFTETVIKTLSRGEIMRWPARIGQCPLL